MRLSFRVIAYMWIGLLMIIGGLLYHAYTNLRPETFIALLSEQVQKNYPGSHLEVGNINYRFSLDFNLNLQNLHLRRSGKLLASVEKVEFKVPWWLLIVNRGHAQINVSKLDIFVDNHKSHQINEKRSATESKKFTVELPTYLSEAKYTLRAKDVSIRDIHDERRYFTLSKLLVREFHYGKNSAFELNIPIEINHNELQHTAELWLFGDVTPTIDNWKLNFRGEFRTKETSEKFQIEDLVIAGGLQFGPDKLEINSQIDLFVEKNNVGKGTLFAGQEKLKLDLNLKSFPISYFSIIYEEISNPYLVKLEGTSEGVIAFEKNLETDLASVSGKLNFDGKLGLSENFSIPGKWQFNFQDSRWDTSFISPKGEASFFRRSVLDVSKRKMIQFNEELGFSELDLSQTIVPVNNLGKILSQNFPYYFHTTISYKNCFLKDRVIGGNFRYGYTPDQKFYQAELIDGEKSFEMNFTDKLNKKFSIKAKNFIWDAHFNFLSPFYEAKHATLSGSIDGNWESEWYQGKWLGNLSVTDIESEKGDFSDLLLNGFNEFNISKNDIKKYNLNLSVSENKINLKTLDFETNESGKITGILMSNTNTKSFLTLAYPKNKKWKPVKKELVEKFWIKKEI